MLPIEKIFGTQPKKPRISSELDAIKYLPTKAAVERFIESKKLVGSYKRRIRLKDLKG